MKSLWLILVALLAVTMLHTANAQTKESAPQEPPFIQENEFDTPKDPLKAETDDAMSIEDEILQSGAQPVAPPKPTPAPTAAPASGNTVDLNKNVPEAGSPSEDFLLEEENPVVAEPSKVPTGEIPMETAPVPVRPAPPVYSNDIVRKSPQGGIEYIHHPQAALGLMRIEKDGTYVYRTTDKGTYKSSGSFQFGMMDAPQITSADGQTSFQMMYDGPQVPLLMFNYDWQPFKSFHNFKVQAGLDLMFATGKGRFTESAPGGGKPQAGDEAHEEYTFVAVPLNLGLIYRFQYMDRQFLAPYILGGGSYIPVVEYRDDGNSTNAVGTPAAYGGGGLLLNIGAMDREASFTMRSEYGITNLWVTLEYRYLKSFSEAVDFSSNILSAGITLDY